MFFFFADDTEAGDIFFDMLIFLPEGVELRGGLSCHDEGDLGGGAGLGGVDRAFVMAGSAEKKHKPLGQML